MPTPAARRLRGLRLRFRRNLTVLPQEFIVLKTGWSCRLGPAAARHTGVDLEFERVHVCLEASIWIARNRSAPSCPWTSSDSGKASAGLSTTSGSNRSSTSRLSDPMSPELRASFRISSSASQTRRSPATSATSQPHGCEGVLAVPVESEPDHLAVAELVEEHSPRPYVSDRPTRPN